MTTANPDLPIRHRLADGLCISEGIPRNLLIWKMLNKLYSEVYPFQTCPVSQNDVAVVHLQDVGMTFTVRRPVPGYTVPNEKYIAVSYDFTPHPLEHIFGGYLFPETFDADMALCYSYLMEHGMVKPGGRVQSVNSHCQL